VTNAHVIRLAVWSGPRNISTALMRSWENRHDTVVIDEPLYPHYLKVTGLDHPGREEVAVSSGGRESWGGWCGEEVCQDVVWCAVAEDESGSIVELGGDPVEVGARTHREIGALREVLA
jgi:hypothetical protein